MRKSGQPLILSEKVSANVIGAKATAFIAVCAAIVSTIFSVLPTGTASAAGGIVITQSNPSIVMGNSSAGADSAAVRVAAKPGDVVTVKLDHHLWDSDTWLSNFPYGTMTKNADSDTVTFTFSTMTTAQVVSIPIDISPSLSHDQVKTPLSDEERAALPAAGSYSIDATLASSDGTVVATQSAKLTVTESKYSTGTAWADAGDFNIKGSYIQGRTYTFKAPTLLSVTYADDSLSHPSWWSARTRITLSVPGKFQLDAAASPGWKQNADGTISFDPTVTGASLNFSGSFTDTPGEHTADNDSTITGYFGSSDSPQKLTLAKKLTVTVLDPATAAAAPVLSITKGVDDTTFIAPDSSPNRPGMANTYDVSYGASVPDSSAEAYKNVTLDVQPADGSYLSAGKLTIKNPSLGATVTVNLTSASGATSAVSYTVTSADVASKDKTATVTLPASTDAGWLEASATISKLDIASTMTMDFPETQAQRKLNDGTPIADGTVRASSATVTGTAESGAYYAGTLTSDLTASKDDVGEKVTYKKPALVNSDLSVEIGVWRSPYKNDSDFVNTFTYGAAGSNLYPALGGSNAQNSTALEIYEPVVYEMLPRKAVYTNYEVKSGVPTPKVTSYQTSDGRTVVKFDWTGTGWWLNTRTDANYGEEFIDVNWKPAASGVKTSSSAAIWVSNVNDPDLKIENYHGAGGTSIDQPIDSGTTAEATQGDSGAVLIGTYTVTMVPPKTYAAFTGTASVNDNRGVNSATGTNVLNSSTTADHKLVFDVINASTGPVSNVQMLVNLPDNLSIEPTGDATVTDANGNTYSTTSSEVNVMYSTTNLEPPSDGSGLLNTNWMPAVTVPALGGWSKVRAIRISVPTSGTQTDYQVSLPVTDTKARDEAKTWGTVTATTYADGAPTQTATVKDSYALMEGVKDWDDDDDANGERPDSIQVNLLNGSKVVETVTVDQWSAWHYDFNASPVDSSGKFIDYTVAEAKVPDNYTATVNGMNLTNTYQAPHLLYTLPFTGGIGYSYTTLAFVFTGVAVVAGGFALLPKRRKQ